MTDPTDTGERPTRHLGLDLGATNLKWAVVEQADERLVDAGSRPGPDADRGRSRRRPRRGRRPARRDRRARAMRDAWARSTASGSASRAVRPGDRRDPLPGQPAGAVGRPSGRRPGRRRRSACPTRLINDARAFGLAELRLGAGRGARSMIGLTLGTGVGGVIVIDGRVVAGPRRDGRRDRAPDDRSRRAARAAAATAAASRRSPGPTGSPPPAGPRPRRRPSPGRGPATRGRSTGLRGVAPPPGHRHRQRRDASSRPTASSSAAGVAAGADVLLDGIRDELRERVRTTSLDEVERGHRRARDVGRRDRGGGPWRGGGSRRAARDAGPRATRDPSPPQPSIAAG